MQLQGTRRWHTLLGAVVATTGLLSSWMSILSGAVVAPNHFLGSCLTNEWVRSMEAKSGVATADRDSNGRLLHPFLKPALPQTRFRVLDARTESLNAYIPNQLPSDTVFYGVGAHINGTDGTVLERGTVNGSLILELSGWATHKLTTLVFAILAQEVYGYPVAMFQTTSTATITQRMSSVHTGLTTPTHVNLEVWMGSITTALRVYTNESFLAGDIGYFGRSGLYTTVDFVKDSLTSTTTPLFANFWKGYEVNEELISAVPESSLRTNAAFFPPSELGCANDTMGCQNHCSRSLACTQREQLGGECLVVVMMYSYYDPGYLQAAMSNNGIPAYFCFLGTSATQAFALEMQRLGRPVLFYHWEPDLFHTLHPGLFDRVFLPHPVPERVVLATTTYGENGYGNATENPVDVDFPTSRLSKLAASVLHDTPRLSRLVSQYSLSDLAIHDLQRKFLKVSTANPKSDTGQEPPPAFQAACEWVQENYDVWSVWLDRLPLCQFETHVQYEVSGCTDEKITNANNTAGAVARAGQRAIQFSWRYPDPQNASLPYTCDGGMRLLPATIVTSRSCAWIHADPSRWVGWIHAKPACDSQFYTFTVSPCETGATRAIRYQWLLPSVLDEAQSMECTGGATLPETVTVACDYVPYSSPVFIATAVASSLLIAVLLFAIAFVLRYRYVPVFKRSQYRLLLLILTGGICVSVAAVLFAGAPSYALCGARRVVMSEGFTMIFGTLLVKSLRVYRVFMSTSSKNFKQKHTFMVKWLVAIAAVDALIITLWYSFDYPEPIVSVYHSVDFNGGDLSRTQCQSESTLFPALLLFWKTILVTVGLYLSFLIRKVPNDFQESVWVFASCVVVLIGCVLILPLAYMVELSAVTFFSVFSVTLLLCTTVVMGLMVIPKAHKLRVVDVEPNVNVVRPRVATNGSSRSHQDVDRSVVISQVRETTRKSLGAMQVVGPTVPENGHGNSRPIR